MVVVLVMSNKPYSVWKFTNKNNQTIDFFSNGEIRIYVDHMAGGYMSFQIIDEDKNKFHSYAQRINSQKFDVSRFDQQIINIDDLNSDSVKTITGQEHAKLINKILLENNDDNLEAEDLE